MIHSIGDGAQTQLTTAALQAGAGVKVLPDRAQAEVEKRRPAEEKADRSAPEEADRRKAEETDPGQKAAKSLISELVNADVGVTFVKVDGVDEPIIRVVNRKTGEVVRQIPPDEVVKLREKFGDLLGMFKDLKA